MSLNFQKDVIEASQETPVVVDFWAEWCAPCKVLGPILEKLDQEANGAWRLVKVNTEQYPQLSAQYGIRGIPAVKMFYGGEVIAEFVGALPEAQVRRWLEEHIPTESKQLVAEAQSSLQTGDSKQARKLLEQAVSKDSSNVEAKVYLAQLLFQAEPEHAAELVEQTPEEHPLFQTAEAVRTLHRLHTERDAILKAAADNEAWRRYLNGIQALQKRDYETAIKSWIDTLLVDKSVDDDGPRRACVALFTLLGQQHELTQRYHRAFTSALF